MASKDEYKTEQAQANLFDFDVAIPTTPKQKETSAACPEPAAPEIESFNNFDFGGGMQLTKPSSVEAPSHQEEKANEASPFGFTVQKEEEKVPSK